MCNLCVWHEKIHIYISYISSKRDSTFQHTEHLEAPVCITLQELTYLICGKVKIILKSAFKRGYDMLVQRMVCAL